MALTPQQQQQLIINMIGDENYVLQNNVPLLWDQWSAKASVHSDLQMLYVRRDAINLVLPVARRKVNFSQQGGVNVSASAYFDHLIAMKHEVQTEIERIESKAAKIRTGATAAISTVTGSIPPGSPDYVLPPDYVDANASIYRGDAYQGGGDGLGVLSTVPVGPGGA